MGSLSVFPFDGKEVRFIDGLPVANDVAIALGYAAPAKTISTKVDEKNKGVTEMVTPGGVQLVTVLKEAGIYQLIFSSKLDSAKRFQDWVFDEVLPSIRETGSYSVTPQPQLPQTYLEALEALVKVEKERLILQAEKEMLEADNLALAEVVDELNNYSSILRVAKFNNVDEKLFRWQSLKAMSMKMGLEVKKVPCPRFEKKNLYHHDVWRYLYPKYSLPETTTITVVTKK